MLRPSTYVFLVAFLSAACSGSTAAVPALDAATDVTTPTDTPAEAAADAVLPDARADATSDVMPDVGADVRADAPADAGDTCAGAADGMMCPSNGQTCGGPCSRCMFCNILRCEFGLWRHLEAFPDPTCNDAGADAGRTFACGDLLRCDVGAQYCRELHGGAVARVSYSCEAFPGPCVATPTCACLGASSGPGSCSMGTDGSVTVVILAP